MPQTLYGKLVERFKRRLIRLALKKSNGKVARAARLLGLHRPDLWELLKKYRIDPKAYQPPAPPKPVKQTRPLPSWYKKGCLLR